MKSLGQAGYQLPDKWSMPGVKKGPLTFGERGAHYDVHRTTGSNRPSKLSFASQLRSAVSESLSHF